MRSCLLHPPLLKTIFDLCSVINVKFWFGRQLNLPSKFVDVSKLVSPLSHVRGVWVTREERGQTTV
ncbi:hypothetical protein TSUD_305360 [Trifolium subterraneum]|uniref:Uncharacterized protein n=1 Tax=Trifolium subterraneum TaxID=3900 RepID=A0A2Z6NEG6_TRISU|nr:hypothetical protein TSUD_305360 [Trifolium subterraneum]